MLNKAKNKIYIFLKWSEKYTKTDMMYLAKGGSWVFATQTIGILSAFTSTVILARVLPVEIFGQYRFVLSILPLLYVFTLPGINLALVRSIARGSMSHLTIISHTKIKWGVVGSLVSLGIAFYYLSKGNEILAASFIVTSFFIPFIETFFLYISYYKGNKNFKTPALYESISRLLQATFLIVAVFITHNIAILIFVFLFSQTITRLFFFLKTKKSIVEESSSDTDADDAPAIIKHGKYLSAISIFSIIASTIDKLMVWHFLGAKMLAIYAIALVFPTNITALLSTPIQNIAAPKLPLIQWNYTEKRKFLIKLGKLAGILSVPVGIYILITHLLFQILFSKYIESIFISQILSLAILFIIPRNMIHEVFIATRNNLAIFLMSIIHLLLIVSLLYVGMNIYGIVGVAYGYLTAEVTTTFIQIIVFLYLDKKNS